MKIPMQKEPEIIPATMPERRHKLEFMPVETLTKKFGDSYRPWEIKYYKQRDLSESLHWQDVKQKALAIWQELSEQAYRKYGDAGCCTLGGGIYIYIMPPRHRHPKRMLAISSPSQWQGEVPKYAGMKEAAEFLKLQGYEVEIDHGRMD